MTTKDFYERRAALSAAHDRAAIRLLVVSCLLTACTALYFALEHLK